MLELTAIFLGGLAFFFLGVDGIRTTLRQMASRRFRQVMSRMTGRGYLAGVWGLLFGAITQSATAVSFLVVGMISSGLLTVQRALQVVAMANLGTVALVFLAAIDISAAVYYLIGVTGLLITFQVAHRLEVSLRALLNVGMLLLGLHLMKQATAPLPNYAWFGALVAVVQGSAFAGFLLGAFLRVVIQSSSAIVIIGIAFAQAGLLTREQVLLLMYGTAIGVGGSTLLLSSNLQGVPRQIAIFQGLINAFTGLFLLIGDGISATAGLGAFNSLTGTSNNNTLDLEVTGNTVQDHALQGILVEGGVGSFDGRAGAIANDNYITATVNNNIVEDADLFGIGVFGAGPGLANSNLVHAELVNNQACTSGETDIQVFGGFPGDATSPPNAGSNNVADVQATKNTATTVAADNGVAGNFAVFTQSRNVPCP